MNTKRKHFQMACLASVAVLLGACSSSGDLKTDISAERVKPASDTLKVAAVDTKPAPLVAHNKTVKTPKVAKTVKAAPAKVTRVAKKVKPKPVTRVVAHKKPVIAPKRAYVPPKPIVVAKVVRPAVKKQVVRRAPVVQKPVVRKQVIRQQQAKVTPPVIRAARVPTQTAKRSVYVSANQAKLRPASYRPAMKPQVARVTPQKQYRNYGQRYLTGDFAGNSQAQAFINMMVSRHGFDRNYVTGVVSKAKATKWLKKMAYSDSHPELRKKSGKAPNWSRYRSRFITSKHINTGTAFYHKYRGSLKRAAAQYGVPEEYILGILGVETIYGGNVGTDRALDALATMSFMNSRRGRYFTSELESYLLMTRRTGLDPLKPKASYAGALGLPQFMPSNIKKYGVDYDGDGAVNLWTPHDAIGSVANYLSKHGWKPGEIAAIPAKYTGGRGYQRLKSGFKHKHSLSKLARKGLKPAYPGVSGNVNMVKLRTNRGNEYWIGGNNFYVITRYNHSSHYAMAVHQLAQEIRSRVKPSRSLPRVIEASADQQLLQQAAKSLL